MPVGRSRIVDPVAAALVAVSIGGFALLVVGALALQVCELTGRLRKLEKAREVERRHRERLTLQVERLQEQGAGMSQDPEMPSAGIVVKNLGPKFKQ